MTYFHSNACSSVSSVIFLVYLSTKCSLWAIVVSGCPSSVVRRRASCDVRRVSCVVCRPSTFDVYTLETTFVIRFLWNLVRMLVLTRSRPSLNMGHVGSKTRSPGQILGNSCLHSWDQICNPILMKLGQNVCFDNRPFSKFMHTWNSSSKARLNRVKCKHSGGQYEIDNGW